MKTLVPIHISELSVSKETIADYFQLLWPSLELYKHEFQHKLFRPEDEVPQYAIYFCPICLEQFIYVQPETAFGSSDFSSDHFPPKNVCGTAKALVCKTCNNTAGHEFDFVTKDFMMERSLAMRIPRTKIMGKVKISGVVGKYSSEISVDENRELCFSFLPVYNKDCAYLQEFLERGIDQKDWKAEITIPGTNAEKAQKAFIKVAYLACFHHWGYEFIFSDTAMHMREVMAGREEYPFKNIPAFIFDQPEHMSAIPLEICFITQPEEWGVFAVNIPLKLSDNDYHCIATVLVPGPDRWADLITLNDLVDPTIDRTVSFTPFSPALLRKEYKGYSSESKMMYKN